MKELIVTAAAQLEIDDAVDWYDAMAPDLADDLLDKVEIAFRQIQDRPAAWGIYAAKYRHFMLTRFPYAIIYRELPESVEILAFAHYKRKPLYWQA